jgi:hypothetical protein
MAIKINILKIMAVMFVVTLVMGAISATALPVYTDGAVDMYLKQNTFPSDLSEYQVFLDADQAHTIIGHVGSQTGTPLVTFYSPTDILVAANGFSTIKADDDYLNEITITAPGYWFEDLIFSVNLTGDENEEGDANTDLEVVAKDNSGITHSFSDWALGSGENRILVLAQTGELMQSITIKSLIGLQEFGGIDQLKQTEISGLTPVPEPATMLLLGSGLIGLAGLGRKKFFKK